MATLHEQIEYEAALLGGEFPTRADKFRDIARHVSLLEAEVARLRAIEQRAEQAHKLMALTRSEEFIGHLQDGAREMPLNQYWTDGATDMLMWVLGWTRPGRWFRWLLDSAGIAPDPTDDAKEEPKSDG